jgi:hypothetical protein
MEFGAFEITCMNVGVPRTSALDFYHPEIWHDLWYGYHPKKQSVYREHFPTFALLYGTVPHKISLMPLVAHGLSPPP